MKHKWKIYVAALMSIVAPLTAHAVRAEDIFISDIKFFSSQREDLHIPSANLMAAMQEFSGARNEEVTKHGHTLLSGCRAHSCTEKGAAVVDLKQKRVLGLALLHYHCHIAVVRNDELKKLREDKNIASDVECDKNPTLSIHLIRSANSFRDIASESQALESLEEWGKSLSYAREEIRVWPKK